MKTLTSIKAQYLLAFGTLGSLLPFLSVYLEARGLTKPQIGDVFGISSAAVIFTPVVITFLADAHVSSRKLLLGIYTLSAVLLAVVMRVEGFAAILFFYCLYSLAFSPMIAVQDGLNFSIQRARAAMGLREAPYHVVRVWGSVGYILPGVVLFVLLRYGAHVNAVPATAIAFCLVGAINTAKLPDPRAVLAATGRSRLPTLGALRAMLEPHVLIFCIAMWLIHVAIIGFYGFYPLYLTQTIGIDRQWVGLIASVGVVIEIGYMLSFGILQRRIGFRGLMLLGFSLTAVRFWMMAAYPNLGVAVGTQIVHGLMALVVHVAPPIFLNHHADESYRSSMQGLYAMLVMGTGRLVGGMISGRLAAFGVIDMFYINAAVCMVAVLLILLAFRERAMLPSAGQDAQER